MIKRSVFFVGLFIAALAVMGQAFKPGASPFVNVVDAGADPRGGRDSAEAFNRALATGKSIYIPDGNYKLSADWMKVQTPRQKIKCESQNAVITSVKPAGTSVSPMIVFYDAAVGAELEGCTFDHNGAQFTSSCTNFPRVPLLPVNTTCAGSDAFNAALGTTVLVIADRVQINGTQVKRGWNVCVGFGIFDLTTGLPTQGPIGGSATRGVTELCGQGQLIGSPNYKEGAGVDNFQGIGIRIENWTDYNSGVGLYLDTGASSSVVDNFVSIGAQISPVIAGTWNNTIGGNALWIGGSNRQFNGLPAAKQGPTIINNFYAYNPMRQCVYGDWSSTGAIVNNLHCVRPGLQGMWIRGGKHRYSNVWIDQANFLRGNTSVSPGTAAEQTNAIQVDGNNAAWLSSLYWDTNVVIDGLNVTNGASTEYAYTFGMTTVGGHVPTLKVTASQQLDVGASGLATGNTEYLNISGTARDWTPSVFGGTTAGTPTYYDRAGTFWQIENTTYVTFNVATSGFGGAAGTINIGNLPKSPAGAAPAVGQCWVTYFNNYNLPTGYTTLGGQIGPTSFVMQFYESGDSVALQPMQLANATANGFRIAGACMYRQ